MAYSMPRQMLLPVVCGRRYNHIVYNCLGLMLLPIIMADVIANIASILLWLVLLPRCHISIKTTNVDICMADVIARWQME